MRDVAQDEVTELTQFYAAPWRNPKFAAGVADPAVSFREVAPLLRCAAELTLRLRARAQRPDAKPQRKRSGEDSPASTSAEDGEEAVGELPLMGAAGDVLWAAVRDGVEDRVGFVREVVEASLSYPSGEIAFGLGEKDVEEFLQGEEASQVLKQLDPAWAFQEAQRLLGEAQQALKQCGSDAQIPVFLGDIFAVQQQAASVLDATKEYAASITAREQRAAAPEPPQAEGGTLSRRGSLDLPRTASVDVAMLKVKQAEQTTDSSAEPIANLARTVSLFARELEEPGGEEPAALYSRLKQLQAQSRNFYEDLMESVLMLDEVSASSDTGRVAKKKQVRRTQELLDQVEHTQKRVQGLLREVESQLPPPKPEHPPVPDSKPQPQPVPPAAAVLPTRDQWRQLRLRADFHPVERDHAYVLSASLPGMNEDDIELSIDRGGALVVEGFRGPSPQQEAAVLGMGVSWSAEEVLRRGAGQFGTFRKRFELPDDANAKEISASYKKGVLQVVVPKFPVHQPGSCGRSRRAPQYPNYRRDPFIPPQYDTPHAHPYTHPRSLWW
mmetsp:Transcript_34592/g.75771  ORF Transcript_34592/g.75771 Transcript_34592/m.75771 type:complete len:554 (+) Transcript_34592:75-1736(+)